MNWNEYRRADGSIMLWKAVMDMVVYVPCISFDYAKAREYTERIESMQKIDSRQVAAVAIAGALQVGQVRSLK